MLLLKAPFLHYHKSCLTSDINPHKGVWVSASLKTQIFRFLHNFSKSKQIAFLCVGYPLHFKYYIYRISHFLEKCFPGQENSAPCFSWQEIFKTSLEFHFFETVAAEENFYCFPKQTTSLTAPLSLLSTLFALLLIENAVQCIFTREKL